MVQAICSSQIFSSVTYPKGQNCSIYAESWRWIAEFLPQLSFLIQKFLKLLLTSSSYASHLMLEPLGLRSQSLVHQTSSYLSR
ncbi:Bgt-21001 [Blumeria graminis f. sp. tritici]|uniref:Bgt-21001 n=1 Tax=Blumeria graminis f. sp. tritici TaxID=62690 RepID=A0A9X9MGB1_BLUGR|nr:Bgt-21001 [Blumeria graminis f. sp. tritici]